ncbi:hypothetical protein [Sphingobacterium sp.]|uniref:hypothetical protein n=1 Tax=Sphingobacterium sp. TaxID=341027 RepID=UPI0028AC4E22|nr:hypothetical protein [Sphingobacterium sp.]
MGLLLVNKNQDYSGNPSAERFQYDALATEGTLLCYDFARQSMAPVGLKKGGMVRDLGRNGNSLNNDTTFKVTSIANEGLDFLTDGTFLLRNTSAGANEATGIDLGTKIQQYLKDNNVKKALFIVWIKTEASGFNAGAVIQSTTSEAIGNNHVIRLSLQSTGNIVITLAGAPTGNISPSDASGKHRQIAVAYEFGKPLTVYKSTVLHSYSANNAGAWGIPNSSFIIGQNSGSDGNLTTATIGRVILEDLDRSGRTSLDVIKEDYDYVNGIGKYAGKNTKRPYADL